MRRWQRLWRWERRTSSNLWKQRSVSRTTTTVAKMVIIIIIIITTSCQRILTKICIVILSPLASQWVRPTLTPSNTYSLSSSRLPTRVNPKWHLDLRTPLQRLPVLLYGAARTTTKICVLPEICTPSNTWFHGPTRVSTPNDIMIGSAVLPGSRTWPTYRQTDTPTDHATPSVTIGLYRWLTLRCGLIITLIARTEYRTHDCLAIHDF